MCLLLSVTDTFHYSWSICHSCQVLLVEIFKTSHFCPYVLTPNCLCYQLWSPWDAFIFGIVLRWCMQRRIWHTANTRTSRFTVVSCHPNVCRHLCQILFTWYFLQFFTNRFQILRCDHGQDLELIDFSWFWLNFQGTGGHYVSKLTFCLRDISCSFLLMPFQLTHMVSIDKTFNLTFHELASIFKVTGGHCVSKLFILLCNAKTS